MRPGTEVIVISGQGTIARALDAGQAGAFFFVEKSQLDPDGLVSILDRAGRQVDERVTHEELRAKLRDPDGMGAVVGQSQVMRELFELVDAVAPSNANVLIQGENGTGKELIANALHHRSPRAKGPFIKINCAAIPKDLIESELFGYKKGAFTGASTDKVGLFELAEGGALMLDEIGEMPAYLQTKLLRVLQEREYRPIGSDRFVKVDFRLICATNVDLDAALRDGRLREDLYFRINTIVLRVPPLRERPEDIPLLSDWFVEKFARRHQKARARRQRGGVSPAHPQPLARQRPRARERHGAGGAGDALDRDPARRSARVAARGAGRRRLHDPAAPHAGRDRAHGDPPDARAHQLEQAGGGADPRPLSADALQQDATSRHRAARPEGTQRGGDGRGASRRWRLVLRAAWRGVGEFYRSEGLTHAASISFYALLSLFPFLLLLFSVIGDLTADPQARDAVVGFVFRYFPQQFDFITRQIDSFRTERVGIGVGGALALAYASLGVFNAMSSAVNHAWGVETPAQLHPPPAVLVRHDALGRGACSWPRSSSSARCGWPKRAGSAPLGPSAGLARRGQRRQHRLRRDAAADRSAWRWCSASSPTSEVRFRDVWPGAMLTGLLWRLALLAVLGLRRQPGAWSVHGSVAAVVVFLLWIYVSAVLLLYGVEMTAAYVRLRDGERCASPAPAGVSRDARSAVG